MRGVRSSLGICPQHDVLFDTLTVDEHLRFFAEVSTDLATQVPFVFMIQSQSLTRFLLKPAKERNHSRRCPSCSCVDVCLVGCRKVEVDAPVVSISLIFVLLLCPRQLFLCCFCSSAAERLSRKWYQSGGGQNHGIVGAATQTKGAGQDALWWHEAKAIRRYGPGRRIPGEYSAFSPCLWAGRLFRCTWWHQL